MPTQEAATLVLIRLEGSHPDSCCYITVSDLIHVDKTPVSPVSVFSSSHTLKESGKCKNVSEIRQAIESGRYNSSLVKSRLNVMSKIRKDMNNKVFDLEDSSIRHNLISLCYDMVYCCLPPSNKAFSSLWSDLDMFYSPNPNQTRIVWGEKVYREFYDTFILPHIPLYASRQREQIDEEVRLAADEKTYTRCKRLVSLWEVHYGAFDENEFNAYVFPDRAQHKKANDHFIALLPVICQARLDARQTPDEGSSYRRAVDSHYLVPDNKLVQEEATGPVQAIVAFAPAPIPVAQLPVTAVAVAATAPSPGAVLDATAAAKGKDKFDRLVDIVKDNHKGGFYVDIEADKRPERIIRYVYIPWHMMLTLCIVVWLLYRIPEYLVGYPAIAARFFDQIRVSERSLEEYVIGKMWIHEYWAYILEWILTVLFENVPIFILNWLITPSQQIIYLAWYILNYVRADYEPYQYFQFAYTTKTDMIRVNYPDWYLEHTELLQKLYWDHINSALTFYFNWLGRILLWNLFWFLFNANKMMHPMDLSRYWKLKAQRQKIIYLRSDNYYTMKVSELKNLRLEEHGDLDLRHTTTRVGKLEFEGLLLADLDVTVRPSVYCPVQEFIDALIRLMTFPLEHLPEFLRLPDHFEMDHRMTVLPIVAADIADLKALTYLNQKEYLERVRLLIASMTGMNYNKLWTVQVNNIAMNTVQFVSALKRYFENQRTGNFEVALWAGSVAPSP